MTPGWKHFRAAPQPGGGLTWAEGYTQTPYGTARSHWEIEGERFALTVEVPAGTTCDAVPPDGTVTMLKEGVHTLQCPYHLQDQAERG